MKFLHYLIYEAPGALKVSIASGFSASFWGFVDILTNDKSIKLATALGAWGGVITMVLAWVYHLVKIRKESK